jgi:PIN domain-containing protein
VRLYAESSAVLAWLFGESMGREVSSVLEDAQFVVASDLTLVECDRALIRAQAIRTVGERRVAELRTKLVARAAHWNLMRLDAPVVARARRTFPGEPIRTLDALHLASALVARASVEDLVMLSLDRRLRASAAELGLAIAPGARA